MRWNPLFFDGKGELEVAYTNSDEKIKTLLMPCANMWMWYPLDISCYYQYSPVWDKVFLRRNNGAKRPNYYEIKPVKDAMDLDDKSWWPSYGTVEQRNKYIMDRARDMNMPYLAQIDDATMVDVEKMDDKITNAFMNIGDYIDDVVEISDRRYQKEHRNPLSERFVGTDVWHRESLKYLNEEEENFLHELGEIRVMLNVMQKNIRQ